jgi:hypothetical protein
LEQPDRKQRFLAWPWVVPALAFGFLFPFALSVLALDFYWNVMPFLWLAPLYLAPSIIAMGLFRKNTGNWPTPLILTATFVGQLAFAGLGWFLFWAAFTEFYPPNYYH